MAIAVRLGQRRVASIANGRSLGPPRTVPVGFKKQWICLAKTCAAEHMAATSTVVNPGERSEKCGASLCLTLRRSLVILKPLFLGKAPFRTFSNFVWTHILVVVEVVVVVVEAIT
jgi:hypothetical protein